MRVGKDPLFSALLGAHDDTRAKTPRRLCHGNLTRISGLSQKLTALLGTQQLRMNFLFVKSFFYPLKTVWIHGSIHFSSLCHFPVTTRQHLS